MKRDTEVDMANKISAVDEELAANVSEALDKSLDAIDELSLQRLKKARAHALNQSSEKLHKPARKWIPLSVAASLAALLLIPIAMHQNIFNFSEDQDMEVIAQEIPYTAEEMDDIEMLMALEDFDA